MSSIVSSFRSLARSSLSLFVIVGVIAGLGFTAPPLPDRPTRPAVPSAGLYLADAALNPGHVLYLNEDNSLTSYYSRTVSIGAEYLTHFAFAPDGTLYYANSNANTIYKWGINGEEIVWQHQTYVRDLAVDTQNVLHFSDSSGGGGDGHIYYYTPATSAVLTYTVLLTEVNGYWGGNFVFDSANNLYLSNGNIANANLYQVVGGTPSIIHTESGEIDGFAIDSVGAFYFTNRIDGIYRWTIGNAPTLVWSIPAGRNVSDVNVFGGAGPIPTRFSGSVLYSAGVPTATHRLASTGLMSVPVTLLGYDVGKPNPIVLDSQLSANDGSYDLGTLQTGFDHFEVVKGVLRGTAPDQATAPANGTILDPATVQFPGSSLGAICCIDFGVRDPVARFPYFTRGRYLIVTRNALVPAIQDFVTYKRFQGWNVIVKTMEELGGSTVQQQRDAIRNYEKTLFAQPTSLKYVLLIGTDATVPMLKLSPFGPDPFRTPSASAAGCGFTPTAFNQCGWPSDWYYVDLNGNWNSNGDGAVGEHFWPDPDKPVPSIKDNEPAFHPDVFVGRIPIDGFWSVRTALDAIMAFDRDNGPYKENTLLTGAMMDYGGQYWEPVDAITGTYKNAGGPTDTGYLMERVWSNALLLQGYNRMRLYEKQRPPTGWVPSGFYADAPLTAANVVNQFSTQNFGLVKTAGHGNWYGVYRTIWTNDYNFDGAVQHPTRPVSTTTGWRSQYELGSDPYFTSATSYWQLKPYLLTAMACSTGDASNSSNLPASLMSNGEITAWTGGTGVVGYSFGWRLPAHGWAQTMDYNISDAMFRRRLPFGDAVWTGLNEYWTTFHAHDWGFINWDLYGDPSQTYWGVGADLRAPWPMFHYDLPGNGESALTGPYSPTIAWSRAIATVPTGTLASSPVIGRDGQIVVGDANGSVRQYQSNGALQWTYHTGGAIVNAAALSADGTVFVKAQDGKLYAIDKNGVLRWSITEGSSEASPKLSGDGALYAGGSIGGSYFIDSFQPNGTRTARLVIDSRMTTAPSIDADGTVWFGTANGTLYQAKFDLTQPISYPISPGDAIGNGLALTTVNRTVIVPTANNSVVAYQTQGSTVRWTFVVSDVVQSAPAFASNGQVFFGSRDGKVYGVRFNDGAKLWEFDTGGPIASSPAVDPTSVYIVGGNPARLYALRRADGVLQWSITIDSESSALGSSPAIGESSTIYLVARNGALVAVGPYVWLRPPIIAIRRIFGPIIVDVQPGDPDPTTLIQVQRRTVGGDWQSIGTFPSDVGQVVDSSVIAGLNYNYRALTLPSGFLNITNAISEPSDYTAPIEVRALEAIPIAPQAPTITALSATDLQLTWPPVPTNTLSLAILRQGPSDSTLVTLTQVPGNVTTTVDSGLLPATTYTYTLRALGEAGPSPSSLSGAGTTLAQTLNPPSNLIVTPLDNTTFQVCWQPSNPTYDAVVARQPDGVSTPQVITTVGAGQTCFTDVNLYAGGFTYFVKHTQGSNESAWAQAARAQAPDFAPTVMRYVSLPVILKMQ